MTSTPTDEDLKEAEADAAWEAMSPAQRDELKPQPYIEWKLRTGRQAEAIRLDVRFNPKDVCDWVHGVTRGGVDVGYDEEGRVTLRVEGLSDDPYGLVDDRQLSNRWGVTDSMTLEDGDWLYRPINRDPEPSKLVFYRISDESFRAVARRQVPEGVGRFQTKPVEVEAFDWAGHHSDIEKLTDWGATVLWWPDRSQVDADGCILIRTGGDDREAVVGPGDTIVRDPDGHFFKVSTEAFGRAHTEAS